MLSTFVSIELVIQNPARDPDHLNSVTPLDNSPREMALPVTSAEDTVRYRVFCSLKSKAESPESSTHEILKQRLAALEKKLQPKVDAYIWHVEKLRLGIVDSPSLSSSEVGELKEGEQFIEAHLGGSVFYGENVDDEWFVAHLFLELTRDDNDLVVQIDDEDGDIFLIEAAHCLPKWLNPENGANRVYLHRGAIHIVPNDIIPQDKLTIKNAVALVRSSPAKTVASSSIQQAIRCKTKDFETPGTMRSVKLHMATLCLPIKAAQMLRDDPGVISDAVRTFYLRTPLDEKALKAMKHFPPEVCVRRNVLMTRFNYAMLRHDNYAPNPVTGWKIPFCKGRDSAEFIEADLGMKIACGLEVLCVSLEEQKASLDKNARFLHYIRRLKERGYFKGYVDGSGQYQELYDKAKGYFLQQDNDGEDPETSHQPRSDFLEKYRSTSVDTGLLSAEEKTLLPADSEQWMTINDEQLNSLLKQYTSGTPSQALQDAFKEDSLVKEITEGLKNFVANDSPLEGVVPPPKAGGSEAPRRRRGAGNAGGKNAGKHKKPSKVTKNQRPAASSKVAAAGVEDLSGMLKTVLDFKIPSESDTDSSSMSSYGEEGDHGEELAKDMAEYLSLMDKELDTTTMGQSFEKKKNFRSAPKAPKESWDDDVPEVDIPLTALKNMLKSSAAAGAKPGPAQNLLHTMGLHLPPMLDSDDDADDED